MPSNMGDQRLNFVVWYHNRTILRLSSRYFRHIFTLVEIFVKQPQRFSMHVKPSNMNYEFCTSFGTTLTFNTIRGREIKNHLNRVFIIKPVSLELTNLVTGVKNVLDSRQPTQKLQQFGDSSCNMCKDPSTFWILSYIQNRTVNGLNKFTATTQFDSWFLLLTQM